MNPKKITNIIKYETKILRGLIFKMWRVKSSHLRIPLHQRWNFQSSWLLWEILCNFLFSALYTENLKSLSHSWVWINLSLHTAASSNIIRVLYRDRMYSSLKNGIKEVLEAPLKKFHSLPVSFSSEDFLYFLSKLRTQFRGAKYYQSAINWRK